MKNFLFSIIAGCILISVGSCKRDDDEPERERRSISRLYVSTSDYAASSAAPSIFNVWPVDNVDAEELPKREDYRPFTSAAKGGRMIHYSPFKGGRIFQGSMNPTSDLDTSVHVMGISKTGVLDNKTSATNRIYDKVRGLYYAVVNDVKLSEDYLLFANASDTTNGTPVPNYTLFAVKGPGTTGRFSRPRYRMKLTHNPWGVIAIEKDLLISKAEENDGAIVVYKGFINKLLQNGDSIMEESDNYLLKIQGANNIRGISYSKSADILMATDYSTSSGSGQAVGRILIFEKFSQYTSAQDIVPTRIIAGDLTRLKEPSDVAIDGKADAKYFFVADPAARRVFRFLISADGNVAPKDELNFDNRPPQSISLDSR
ncbi:hypothetical protein [Sphingobacterium faecale]|uniref:DUF4374 domain-containing protein n=1 Tax=Sphingobacterium faecale TaxID=2803775 RepID=A0ABS1QZR5_9SPHI|nr:hypothetical protein [Sphingobacterium faecale]MBL1407918.1 hypothetical protein [Sphingobacterium faecale]